MKIFVAATYREKSNQTEFVGLVAGILLQRQRFSQKIIQYTRGDSRSEAMCHCNVLLQLVALPTQGVICRRDLLEIVA